MHALLMLADYVQDTKDPQANAQEVWGVETMVLHIIERLYMRANPKPEGAR